jgi:hypothetical protein
MILREYKPSDCPFLWKLFYDAVHTVNARDYTGEQLDARATKTVDLNEWNRSFRARYSDCRRLAEKDARITREHELCRAFMAGQ